MKYRPEIDGLRTVAVVPVILFHAGFTVFSGGFVGVDIFFVISGFLITTIILADLEKRKFSIVNFYERRARRIMPMLFFIMGLSLVMSWFTLLPSEMKSFSNSITSVSLFSSNFLFWRESGYWDTVSELKPLLHTWSLAVEEQFYIIFPILLLALRYLKNKWTLIIVVIGSVLSLALAQYASGYPAPSVTKANFYLLPTRAWELAIGAIVAIVACHYPLFYQRITSRKKTNELFAAFGLLIILFSIFFFDATTPFPSLYALLPTIGTGLIILFGSGDVFIGRILSLKPLVKIGLISYSAYLLHQPLFAFLKYKVFPEPSIWLMSIATISVFPLSYLTWKYVENPFRNKQKFNRKRIFSMVLITSILFIVVGVAGNYTNGFENRSIAKNLKIENYTADNSKLQKGAWKILREKSGNPEYGVENNSFDNQSWFNENDIKKKLLVIGNSHSKDLYNTLISSVSATKNFQIGRFGLQIRDLSQFDNIFYSSPNYRNADVIFIASQYSEKDVLELDKVLKRLRKDDKVIVLVESIHTFSYVGNRSSADFYIQENELSGIDSDKRISSITEAVNKINEMYYNDYKYGSTDNIAITKEINLKIREIGSKNKDVIILDRMDYICDDLSKQCFAINNQLEKFFPDGSHNTLAGAKYYGTRIDEIHWLDTIINFSYKQNGPRMDKDELLP